MPSDCKRFLCELYITNFSYDGEDHYWTDMVCIYTPTNVHTINIYVCITHCYVCDSICTHINWGAHCKSCWIARIYITRCMYNVYMISEWLNVFIETRAIVSKGKRKVEEFCYIMRTNSAITLLATAAAIRYYHTYHTHTHTRAIKILP